MPDDRNKVDYVTTGRTPQLRVTLDIPAGLTAPPLLELHQALVAVTFWHAYAYALEVRS